MGELNFGKKRDMGKGGRGGPLPSFVQFYFRVVSRSLEQATLREVGRTSKINETDNFRETTTLIILLQPPETHSFFCFLKQIRVIVVSTFLGILNFNQ